MCLLIIIIFLLILMLFVNTKNNFIGYPLFNSRLPISYNPNMYPSEIVSMNSSEVPFLRWI